MFWPGVWTAALAAALMASAAPFVVRRLPEPVDDPDAHTKRPYAALATPRFAGLVGLLTLSSALVVAETVPTAGWLAWSSLAAPGALAVAIDGATTWIPRLLTRVMGLVAVLGLTAWALVAQDLSLAVRAGVGAVAVGGFFFLFWRFTGGIGFADVRLMAVVGAVAAAHSAQTATWGVLLGTLVGAVWGIVRRLAKGPGEFAYGPALWSGPFLALLLDAWM